MSALGRAGLRDRFRSSGNDLVAPESDEEAVELADDILATTNCGFACVADRHLVDPRIAWAKLGALVEGAALVAC